VKKNKDDIVADPNSSMFGTGNLLYSTDIQLL
jgi:hypothetical protein